jgi:hypothetical protein
MDDCCCKSCRFFRRDLSLSFADGRCHRRAPTGPESTWPTVAYSDWCGEYEPRGPVDQEER